ncbi:interferon regulatory factor 5-like [Lineus longissimus]|uniref:interferon regulatory factor 5-like n=1 Tax=Lineus longissimus TaxID=88925 RepID=UPI002B4D3381
MPPKEKKLLRRFLFKCLDEGHMKGIRWMNRDEKTFQLLWLHANSPEWCEENGALFKEWAIYKGRYQQQPDGTMPPDDYTNWKANFRCAINRCNDIKEIKMDTGNKDLKTYMFIPRRHEDQWEIYQPFPNSTWRNEDGDEKNVVYTTPTSQSTTPLSYQARMPVNTDPYATVAFVSDAEAQYLPEVLEKLPVSPPASLPTDDYNFEIPSPHQLDLLQQMINENGLLDLLQCQSVDDNERNVNSLMDLASIEAPGIDPQHAGSNVSLPDSLSLVRFVNTKPEMIDMIAWLRYREKVVEKKYIRCDRGFRLMNADGERRSQIPEKFSGCSLLGTPAACFHAHRNIENTERIIKFIGNGLHLFCDKDGNISATRLTSCRIYYADPTLKKAAEPQLLPRRQSVKVFDKDAFNKKLADWEKNENSGERPSVSILFSLGENWSLSKPINKCYMNLMVVHCYSWSQLGSVKVAETAQFEEEMEGACAAIEGLPIVNMVQ